MAQRTHRTGRGRQFHERVYYLPSLDKSRRARAVWSWQPQRRHYRPFTLLQLPPSSSFLETHSKFVPFFHGGGRRLPPPRSELELQVTLAGNVVTCLQCSCCVNVCHVRYCQTCDTWFIKLETKQIWDKDEEVAIHSMIIHDRRADSDPFHKHLWPEPTTSTTLLICPD